MSCTSARTAGAGSRWYQAAREHGHGRIRLGNVTRDVALETPVDEPAAEIDAAYRRMYGQAAGSLVASPAAHAATVRIVPAG
ncbi:hypothetical protein H4696_005760 [Amycolatopsis lexingtonensis]|uniref:DUF2255 family protein n=1 Tax=Amycolatopsis lexingtonensis TaxID=218822 RepID=A0ABR9I633_9PSEU|nr:DUF2255 family protein [Amycolatopsis lexingtonensis]MBE1498660.1 hypothetical protein [Amycolatopsis lexingtonensis]